MRLVLIKLSNSVLNNPVAGMELLLSGSDAGTLNTLQDHFHTSWFPSSVEESLFVSVCSVVQVHT